MIVDITNELLTRLKSELTDVNVISSYQSNPSKFPTVLFEESDNSSYLSTKDSSGFQHSNIAFSVEIYTTGSKKMSDAKLIRNKIDLILSGEYGLARKTPIVIPNFLDNSIYRYKLSYSGLIGKDKKIYRG